MKISTKVECGIIALIDIAIHSEKRRGGGRQPQFPKGQNPSVKPGGTAAGGAPAPPPHGPGAQEDAEAVAPPGPPTELLRAHHMLAGTPPLGDVDAGGADDTSLLKATIQESLWDKMTAYLRQFCTGITLQDMMDRYRSAIPQDEAFMYYI